MYSGKIELSDNQKLTIAANYKDMISKAVPNISGTISGIATKLSNSNYTPADQRFIILQIAYGLIPQEYFFNIIGNHVQNLTIKYNEGDKTAAPLFSEFLSIDKNMFVAELNPQLEMLKIFIKIIANLDSSLKSNLQTDLSLPPALPTSGTRSAPVKVDDVIQLLDEPMQIGVAEYKGKRSAQEDTETHGSAPELKINDAAQKAALQNTFRQMQQYATAVNHKAGSCAIATVMQSDPQGVKVTTAYVGDSGAYVLTLNKKGEAISCVRLNKNLHTATHGTLAVSHAIGDNNELPADKHDPEIDTMIIPPAPPGCKNILCLTCDGILEAHRNKKENKFDPNDAQAQVKAKVKEEKYMVDLYNRSVKGKKISNNRDRANALAETALEVEKSNDNLTAVVIPIPDPTINPKEAPPLTEPLVGAVFDGHGGKYVSQLLKEKFIPALRRNATLALSQAQAPSPIYSSPQASAKDHAAARPVYSAQMVEKVAVVKPIYSSAQLGVNAKPRPRMAAPPPPVAKTIYSNPPDVSPEAIEKLLEKYKSADDPKNPIKRDEISRQIVGYYRLNDKVNYIKWLHIAANDKDPDALLSLIVYYKEGRQEKYDIKENPLSALEYIKKLLVLKSIEPQSDRIKDACKLLCKEYQEENMENVVINALKKASISANLSECRKISNEIATHYKLLDDKENYINLIHIGVNNKDPTSLYNLIVYYTEGRKEKYGIEQNPILAWKYLNDLVALKDSDLSLGEQKSKEDYIFKLSNLYGTRAAELGAKVDEIMFKAISRGDKNLIKNIKAFLETAKPEILRELAKCFIKSDLTQIKTADEQKNLLEIFKAVQGHLLVKDGTQKELSEKLSEKFKDLEPRKLSPISPSGSPRPLA